MSITLASCQSLRNYPLVTTGGTISAAGNDEGALVAGINGADKFRTLVQDDLVKSNIQISPTTYAPYAILSENINLGYVEKLVDELLRVIESEDPELIVVSHGTDSMDKVVKLLDYPVDETLSERINQSLIEKIIKLQNLIEQKGIFVVFTGSNTNDEVEIKANLTGAFRVLEGPRRPLHPGVYISFHGDLIKGRFAVKDIYSSELEGMRYADSRDENYKLKVDLQNQRDQLVITDLEQKIGPRQIPNNWAVQEYDVTQLHQNHKEFKAQIKERSKAVLLYLYHGGTANTDSSNPDISVEELVKDLRRKHPDLVFFAVTENFEPTDLMTYETSRKLLKAGVVPLYDMSKNVALAKLQMLQLNDMKSTEIIDEMLKPLANEITPARIDQANINEIKSSYAVAV